MRTPPRSNKIPKQLLTWEPTRALLSYVVEDIRPEFVEPGKEIRDADFYMGSRGYYFRPGEGGPMLRWKLIDRATGRFLGQTFPSMADFGWKMVQGAAEQAADEMGQWGATTTRGELVDLGRQAKERQRDPEEGAFIKALRVVGGRVTPEEDVWEKESEAREKAARPLRKITHDYELP